MERELKWKADATLQAAVAEWALARGAVACVSEMDARYYDTADGILNACKSGLRIRSENGERVCCLKRDRRVNGAEHVREEYEIPARTIEEGLAALPRAGAPETLCKALLAAGVHEICRTSFMRRAFTLSDTEMTAELALDCGTLSREDRAAPLCEIELEHKSGSETAFSTLAEDLVRMFSCSGEPLSKLVRAMSL